MNTPGHHHVLENRHLVLIGLPGSGKSSTGRRLARLLERSFVDLDSEIERHTGMSVRQIFAQSGEPAFREAEAAASHAIAAMHPVVLAPGGGWATNPPAVAHLRPRSCIVYLRVPPEEALRRLGAGVARRPLLVADADPLAALRTLEAARRSVYESISDAVVDTSGTGLDVVASRVLAAIQNATSEEGVDAGRC